MDNRNRETGMKDTDMSEAPVKDRIEWFGIDGIMVLGYFVLVAIMFCSIKYHIDVLTAFVFPLTLLAIVFTVTVNYAKTLRSFIKMQNQKIKENK
jgi:uncharacterized membrane protein SirB2